MKTPDGSGVIRIPGKASGSWTDMNGQGGETFDIERPSVKRDRAAGWPHLYETAALIAFRDDGKVYVVAEPADAARWTTCHVFDTTTGYHVHTIHRESPK